MTSDREWLRLVIDLRLPIPPQDTFAGLGPKEYRAAITDAALSGLRAPSWIAAGVAVVAASAGPPPPGTHPPNPTLTRVDYDTGEVL